MNNTYPKKQMETYSAKSIRKKFAERGVFYTDEKLAIMLKEAVEADGSEVTEIYDPTCGAGNLLAVFPESVKKYGQEIDPAQAAVAQERLTNAEISAGDTLAQPAFAERRFRHIVANPPFSVKWEPHDDWRWAGAPVLPPPSKADYAFILHILALLADDGVAAVLSYPGICYRGQREAKIREWIVKCNLIESITSIEGGYFEDTAIGTVLIVFRKNKATTDIKFVNREDNVERIVSLEEVLKNDCDLSVNRYARKEKPTKENTDLAALEIKAREDTLNHVKAQLELSSLLIDLNSTLGEPEIPPLSEFVADLIALIAPYSKEKYIK